MKYILNWLRAYRARNEILWFRNRRARNEKRNTPIQWLAFNMVIFNRGMR